MLWKTKTLSQNKPQSSHQLFGLLGFIGLAICLPLNVHAQPIPEFTATFNIHALSMKLGVSKHSLACQQTNCTLSAASKPQGLAKFFLNERSLETIKIQQTDSQFKWLAYEKKYGENLSEKGKFKTDAYFINPQNPNEIINPRRQKNWPIQPEIYDSISLAYAVQFNVLNEKALNQLFLQENKRQQPLILKKAFTKAPLTLDNGQTLPKAQLFEFKTLQSEVKIWLLPTYGYFPGRVDVYNIKKDKTLTLVLQEPPKIQ